MEHGAWNKCNHSFLLSLLFLCLFRCIMVLNIPVGILDFLRTMRNDRDELVYTSVTYGTHTHRSECVSYPSRRPYHRFRHRSLKPSKWVRNRQSSVRNQTFANGDDTSRYRYRYDLAFLAVYYATDEDSCIAVETFGSIESVLG